MELKINKQLEDIIPKLKDAEYQALKENIKEKGLLKPIDVMPDGTIVDGHHRYKACKELGVEPLSSVMPNITTIEQALEYSFNVNFARRHLTDFEKVEWAKSIVANATERDLAKKVGVSHDKTSKVARILDEKAYPKALKEQMKTGELTIGKGYEILKQTEAAKALLETASTQVKEDLTKEYKPSFYTETLDLAKIQHDISIAEGNEPDLKQVKLPDSNFKDSTEADTYAKQYGGRYLRKESYWVLEVDPYKYKEEQEDNEPNSEKS